MNSTLCEEYAYWRCYYDDDAACSVKEELVKDRQLLAKTKLNLVREYR